MGLNLNWIAVESGDKTQVLARLGLREIGAANDEMSSAYACAVTTEGWIVVVAQSMKLDLKRLLPTVSSAEPALGGEVSEIVMFSRLQGWQGGRRLWSVTHDADKDVDLEVEGESPPQLAAIAARLRAEQMASEDPVDSIFDAPLELGQAMCGYRPGEGLRGGWSMLGPARGAEPWLSALPGAIRSDLQPSLPELGWDGGSARLAATGLDYEATRVRGGRLEALRFLWRDDGQNLEIIPSLAVLKSGDVDGELLVSGIYRMPPERPGLSAWLRQFGRPKPSYEDRVRMEVARMRGELPAIDRFLEEADLAADGAAP